MDNYISECVHPKSQSKLKKLIDNFVCSVEDYEYLESKQYYYAGYTVDQVADQAGHSSLNTTKKYLDPDRQSLMDLSNKL